MLSWMIHAGYEGIAIIAEKIHNPLSVLHRMYFSIFSFYCLIISWRANFTDLLLLPLYMFSIEWQRSLVENRQQRISYYNKCNLMSILCIILRFKFGFWSFKIKINVIIWESNFAFKYKKITTIILNKKW